MRNSIWNEKGSYIQNQLKLTLFKVYEKYWRKTDTFWARRYDGGRKWVFSLRDIFTTIIKDYIWHPD